MAVYDRSLHPQSAGAPQPLLLPPAQAARALGISPRTLWGMTKRGEIPHLHLGRKTVYPVAALQRWIEARTKADVTASGDNAASTVRPAGKGVQG